MYVIHVTTTGYRVGHLLGPLREGEVSCELGSQYGTLQEGVRLS